MQVRNGMTDTVLTVGPGHTLREAARLMAQKKVVACDVVELSPLPGLMAPNFLCAKLVYKILGYRFGMTARRH